MSDPSSPNTPKPPSPPGPPPEPPTETYEGLEEYDEDAVVLQLDEVGQRIEIMLEAAGGPYTPDEGKPTSYSDLPTDIRYQEALTRLYDQLQITMLLRRLYLRDDEDADAADADAEAADAGSPDAAAPPSHTPTKKPPRHQ